MKPLFLPWRVVESSEGTFEVWTREDHAPGSRNNYAIAIGIQSRDEADFMVLSCNRVLVDRYTLQSIQVETVLEPGWDKEVRAS